MNRSDNPDRLRLAPVSAGVGFVVVDWDAEAAPETTPEAVAAARRRRQPTGGMTCAWRTTEEEK